MKKKVFKIDQNSFKRALKMAARTYDDVSAVPKAVANRLLDRLDFIRLKPICVIDIGARTGYTTQRLEQRYPKAVVVGLDFNISILTIKTVFSKMIVGEYTVLPLLDRSVDLIFSNLTFQWSKNLQKTLQECYRVLRPGGLLLFSTVGPDTLRELRTSFSDSAHYHVHPFYDMHDIGDVLAQLHFVNPVMDTDHLIVYYSSVSQLIKDLKQLGAQNASQDRLRGLMGKNRWKKMLMNYENWREKSGSLPATVEIIFGHAFGAENSVSENLKSEVTISVDKITRRKN